MTSDGAVWVQAAVTRAGLGLYCPEGVARCPRFVMATLAELAEHGVKAAPPVTEVADAVALMGALPMPVSTGPAPMTPEQRKALAVQIGDVQPATDALIGSFAKSVADIRNHEHPTWEDLYCMNLSSWMGERIAPVLKRLLDTETENVRLRTQVAELEAATYVAPSPSCTTCYGADAVRFVANGGALAPCRACAPAGPAEGSQSAPPAPAEDPHDSPLHHTYALGRDLPTGGAQ
ncbi:hypothetical protein [Streptomyces sp. NPDC017448]|uniref:hypothetical protein n=1 Tax=Streptomyces sp. NPDC017448 TaxID=3364996 RepID=UPI0037951AC3